jgi:hypothetical protein
VTDYLLTAMAELDQARQQAVRLLCQAHADDRLNPEAFDSRLERIKLAPNEATLAAILADLDQGNLPVLYHQPLPAAQPVDHTDVAPVSPAEYLRIASVFGSTKRAGSWTVPLALDVRVLLGEVTIDLRDAVFGSDLVEIEVDAKLGSFTLIVPAGTQVENEIEEILSSSTHSTRNSRGVGPNGLLIRLRGRAVISSIDVKEKLPTKSGKADGLFARLLGSGD